MTFVAPVLARSALVCARMTGAVRACSARNPLCACTPAGTPGNSDVSGADMAMFRSVRSDRLRV